ncbi:MAG: hypothetical protein H8E79_00685 [Desulfobulbaceae bacterium]|uniref:Uncharacterized protein n=1 Tax=Candidatus Desulfatifera sulfidica TaxID=2841691 RepID=A0A8J6N6N4_9BACT|nr:hypothetical protein [Candidatus Desulfatifera sulfidica]
MNKRGLESSLTELYGVVYGGAVADRLSFAHELAHCYGRELLADEVIAAQLKLTLQRARLLEQQMTVMEMGKTCSACAVRPDGGCCSYYMTNENDGLQLFMNILAGLEVSVVRDDGVECSFLGSRGCILLLKPLFCLNYNCAEIKQVSAPADLGRLEQKTGDLLRAQVVLEQLLIAFLQRQS